MSKERLHLAVAFSRFRPSKLEPFEAPCKELVGANWFTAGKNSQVGEGGW